VKERMKGENYTIAAEKAPVSWVYTKRWGTGGNFIPMDIYIDMRKKKNE
jgi:hypothetical protein